MGSTSVRRLIGGVLILALVLWACPQVEAKAPYQGEWFGLDEAHDALQGAGFAVEEVSSHKVPDKAQPVRSLILIVGAARPFRDAELSDLDAFMREGGAVLVNDDLGYGSELASRYGIGFRSRTVHDADFSDNESEVHAEATVASAEFPVLLDSPVALMDYENRTNLETFLRTTERSYIDVDQDGRITVLDKAGPFNVGIRATVGVADGEVAVISDASWIANEMFVQAENERFLLALVDALVDVSGPRTVYLDDGRDVEKDKNWLPAPGALASLLALLVPSIRRPSRSLNERPGPPRP